MREVILTRELLQEEAASILRSVHDNAAAGRSNKLGDVKEALEAKVTLDFDDYFLFLRKFNFVLLDRELGALALTADGERILGGTAPGVLETSIEQFFGSRLGDEVVREDPTEQLPRRPPPLNAPEVTEGRRPPPPVPLALTTVAAPPPSAAKTDKAVEARAAEARGSELDLRYVKYESLGGGAMATVFRGKQTGLGIDVAVKELRDIFAYFSFLQRGEVIKRLKKELCAQAQLRHPGVVGILDQNCEVARPYYVLELCSGGSLRQRLDALGGKPLAVNEALRHFLQVCYALRASHQVGLLHQNLKPENILVDHLGNAKLADFGMSRVIETDNPQKQMPQVFMGTGGMGYLPPEQLTAKKDFGPESDLYMLGLILYEMLTGQLPGRRSPLPSAANSAVPAKIDPIFDRMTQDRREARYPSVDALLDDFYAAFSDGRFLHKGDLVLSSGAPAEPAAAEGEGDKDKRERAEGKDKERRAS
ncbi:MAG TPA: serine/threonine-protein kinase [Myxococcales bacterium]|nr:serine/threonine-protein kinase [Myxococcales bacterium]